MFTSPGSRASRSRNHFRDVNAIGQYGPRALNSIFMTPIIQATFDGAIVQLSPTFVLKENIAGPIYGIAMAGPYIKCANAATVTTAIGIRGELMAKDSAATVTNAYTLYIDAQTIGSSINRSIYVSGGVSEFDGQLIAKGTSTNDNAAAGDIGEYIESDLGSGSAVSLTTTVATDVTSISLTAGDWDCWGTIAFVPASGTQIGTVGAWVSTTSATFPSSTGVNKAGMQVLVIAPTTNKFHNLFAGYRRFSLSSTTTTYLTAYASFSVSTCTAYGTIAARRVR